MFMFRKSSFSLTSYILVVLCFMYTNTKHVKHVSAKVKVHITSTLPSWYSASSLPISILMNLWSGSSLHPLLGTLCSSAIFEEAAEPRISSRESLDCSAPVHSRDFKSHPLVGRAAASL